MGTLLYLHVLQAHLNTILDFLMEKSFLWSIFIKSKFWKKFKLIHKPFYTPEGG